MKREVVELMVQCGPYQTIDAEGESGRLGDWAMCEWLILGAHGTGVSVASGVGLTTGNESVLAGTLGSVVAFIPAGRDVCWATLEELFFGGERRRSEGPEGDDVIPQPRRGRQASFTVDRHVHLISVSIWYV